MGTKKMIGVTPLPFEISATYITYVIHVLGILKAYRVQRSFFFSLFFVVVVVEVCIQTIQCIW